MAAPNTQSSLLVKQQQYGSVSQLTEQHLSNVMGTRPEIIGEMVYAYNNKSNPPYTKSIIHALTLGAGATETIMSDEIQWDLMGKVTKAIGIAVAPTPAPGTNNQIGFGKTPFTIGLREKLLFRNWTVRFPDGTTARVDDEPKQAGNIWYYTMVLCGADNGKFLSPEYCKVGDEIGWIANNHSEKSESTGMLYSAPMRLRNGFSLRRYDMSYTRTAQNTAVAFYDRQTFKRGEKNTPVAWVSELEWQYHLQWMALNERAVWLDEYNRRPDGTYADYDRVTGLPIKTGAGIEQQISSVNTIIADRLELDMLWHICNNIRAAAGDAENMAITMYTGNGGAKLFHDALMNSASAMRIVDQNNFIHHKDKHKLGFGAQFTTYMGPEGCTITVINHPFFNDTELFTNRNTPHGYTDYSYKMFFLDHGTDGTSPNVKYCIRGSGTDGSKFLQWGTGGSILPVGYTGNGGVRSHDKDEAAIHCLSQTAVVIKNPYRSGLIDLSRQFL